MNELDRIIEGVIQKGKAEIAQRLNDMISMIGDAAEDIGFGHIRINYVGSAADVATIEISLPTSDRQTITVFVYDEDDIKIEVPEEVAQTLNIPNYYAVRTDDLSPEDIAVLGSGAPPTVGATVSKLQEIWMQLRDHMRRQ